MKQVPENIPQNNDNPEITILKLIETLDPILNELSQSDKKNLQESIKKYKEFASLDQLSIEKRPEKLDSLKDIIIIVGSINQDSNNPNPETTKKFIDELNFQRGEKGPIYKNLEETIENLNKQDLNKQDLSKELAEFFEDQLKDKKQINGDTIKSLKPGLEQILKKEKLKAMGINIPPEDISGKMIREAAVIADIELNLLEKIKRIIDKVTELFLSFLTKEKEKKKVMEVLKEPDVQKTLQNLKDHDHLDRAQLQKKQEGLSPRGPRKASTTEIVI